MWKKILLTLFLVISTVLAAKKGNSAATTAELKLQQIRELSAKSKGNVITLDDASFQYYATNKPRPYSLVVFMTATHPKFRCQICKQIDQELTLVAQSYSQSLTSSKSEQEVFFVRIDYETSGKSFHAYGVTSVPVVFYLPPSLAAETTNTKETKESKIAPRDKFQVPAVVDAESIANFVRDRSGVSIDIKRSLVWLYITLLVVLGVLLALVKPVIDSLPFWLNLIRRQSIWVVVSLGIYTCAISGMIFDIIRSPPLYHMNPQSGQILFFYPQSGNQFVVEGFVIGFLNLACAISLVVISVYVPKFKDEQNRMIGMIGGIVVFAFCFRMIRSLYIMKNQWYGQVF